MLTNAIKCFPDSLFFPYRLSSLDNKALSPELFNKLSRQAPDSATPENRFCHYWLLSKYASNEYEPISEMEYLAKAHAVYLETTEFRYDANYFLDGLKQASVTAKDKFEASKSVQTNEGGIAAGYCFSFLTN